MIATLVTPKQFMQKSLCKFNIVIFARQSAHSIRMCNCVLWKKGIELYFYNVMEMACVRGYTKST